jgi:cytochrome oxidase Cu insertion factor (SCO1/SenC/PrrC family)
MKIRKSVFGLLLVVAVVVSACGVSASAREAAPQPEAAVEIEMIAAEGMTDEEMHNDAEKMDDDMSAGEETMGDDMSTAEPTMDEDMSKGDEMMDGEMSQDAEKTVDDMSKDGEMVSDDMSKDDEMMDAEMSQDEMMADEGAMMLPAWYGVELTDVNTGVAFKVADFQDKVILVETMAVWCSTCLRQQQQVQALHELLGDREDVVSLALDIDPNETPDVLKSHADRYGFDWIYAVAPVEVAREIGQLYGDQFLNPPSAPVLIIDRQGEVHPLPFGVKSAQALQEALSPYLN